jgi:hypothetical protein
MRDKFAIALLLACEESRIPKNNDEVAMIAMEVEAALYVFN